MIRRMLRTRPVLVVLLLVAAGEPGRAQDPAPPRQATPAPEQVTHVILLREKLGRRIKKAEQLDQLRQKLAAQPPVPPETREKLEKEEKKIVEDLALLDAELRSEMSGVNDTTISG